MACSSQEKAPPVPEDGGELGDQCYTMPPSASRPALGAGPCGRAHGEVGGDDETSAPGLGRVVLVKSCLSDVPRLNRLGATGMT